MRVHSQTVASDMRVTFALVMFRALPYAYAGLSEDELFEKIEERKEVDARTPENLARIAYLAKRVDLTIRGQGENTPLLLAAANGDLAVVRVLLGLKADPETRNMLEQTALLAAVEHRRYDVATALVLEYTVDSWARDYEGNTVIILTTKALPSLTGTAKEDAELLLEILRTPRVVPAPCTANAPAPTTNTESRFGWLTPFRAAGVVAVALVAVAAARSSTDGSQ